MANLTKYNKQQIAQHTTTAPVQKPVTLKHIMLLDTGDGAFTDESVKVKPCKGDDRKLVLKCTDPQRLLDAAKRMGLALAGKPTQGTKHFILFVWKQDFGLKLNAQAAQQALPPKTAQQVQSFQNTKQLVAKGGAK